MTLPLGAAAPPLLLARPEGMWVTPVRPAPDEPVLVAFLCNHCPYVKWVAPRLGELASSWSAAGVAVYGVNSNAGMHPGDAPDRMPRFAGTHGWTFPYLVDPTQDVAQSFGAVCTPEFFLFDQAHRLRYHGRFDESRPGSEVPITGLDLDVAVRKVLAGELPPADQFPSVGCGIKWAGDPEDGSAPS